jgi:hypothetical protein
MITKMGEMPFDFKSHAVASPPESWTRIEHNEREFIRSCRDHTDGVVVAARFASLATDALHAEVPFLIDLETYRLPFLNGPEDESFGRDAKTTLARSVPIPVTSSALEQDLVLERLVSASIALQTGARMTFAPDFMFESLDDPLLTANLRSIALAQRLQRRQQVAAWIHVTLDTMTTGTLEYAAERYVAALPRGSTVVLTVSDLQAGLGVTELEMYFSALAAFDSAGLRVIVDRASMVSVAAVATYAGGCMLGTRLYRTAPASPAWTSELNPRIPLGYFDGRNGRRLSLRVARERCARGTLTACAQRGGCNALNSKVRPLDIRLHNAHDVRNACVRARELGAPALVRLWRRGKLKHLRTWAQALDRASARREQA